MNRQLESEKKDSSRKGSFFLKSPKFTLLFCDGLEDSSKSEEFVDGNLLVASAAKLKGTLLEYQSDNNAAGYFVTSIANDICQYGSARKLFENKMISPTEVAFY